MLADVRTWKDDQLDAAKAEVRRKKQRAASIRWNWHNRERMNELARARYAANPGPHKERALRWKLAHPERWAAYFAEWRERNAWRLGRYRLLRSAKNPERLLSRSYGFCQLHEQIHGTGTLSPLELLMQKEEQEIYEQKQQSKSGARP